MGTPVLATACSDTLQASHIPVHAETQGCGAPAPGFSNRRQGRLEKIIWPFPSTSHGTFVSLIALAPRVNPTLPLPPELLKRAKGKGRKAVRTAGFSLPALGTAAYERFSIPSGILPLSLRVPPGSLSTSTLFAWTFLSDPVTSPSFTFQGLKG